MDKKLNCTLAIDSPFQTFAVGLLIKFIDLLYHCFLQKRFLCRANQGFSYITEAAPAVLKWSGQEVGGAMSSGGCG